ncbi:hypothetical protein Q5P01_004460 [Channa striata]|uniref:CC chemokine n=1 Tax=Channa striata TaxID=64152 RepID=A0AA88NNP8_CHASR|nr:hypothetical protein Q5P01_004460 [Channa striata]
MRTTLSSSRWICLFALAVVMTFSASEVDSQNLAMQCCPKVQPSLLKESIKECYRQDKRDGCQDAFVIKTTTDKILCVKHTAPRIEHLVKTGKLACPRDISKRHKFKVYNDVE